jgi:hypothetical protein
MLRRPRFKVPRPMKQRRPIGPLASLAVALLIGVAAPMPCRAQSGPEFEQRYDRFKDYTSLELDLGQVIRGSNHEVKLAFIKTFNGEGRKAKSSPARLMFHSDSSDGWVYLDHHPVTLLVDGERMRFDPKHDGTVGKGYVLEFMLVRPGESQLQRLFGANKIEGQVGIHEFKLKPDQLAAIKEFATLVETPDRPIPSGRFVAPALPPKPKSPEDIAREQEAQRLEATRLQEDAQRQKEKNRRQQEAQLINKLDQNLRLGKVLEKSNTKAALQYYKEVVDLAPKSSQAKAATERIKALSKTK